MQTTPTPGSRGDYAKAKDNRSGWGFVVAVVGFCFLLAVHMTLFGVVAVGAIFAAVSWALFRH